MKLETIQLDKVGSAAGIANTGKTVSVFTGRVKADSGDLVVVRALTESFTYGRLEIPGGRLARIKRDDILLGVLGRRRALKGFVGEVPKSIAAGDKIQLLNMGGVMGQSLGQAASLSEAIDLEVVGVVADENGKRLNLSRFGMPASEKLRVSTPIILVAGTCMNSGKTESAVELIKQATRRGITAGGVKLSGIACLRDTLNMQDHGAIATASFLDCGIPSTAGADRLADIARAVLNRVSSSGPDVIVAELGDGVVGGYAIEQILSDVEIMSVVTSIVFCASDYVGVIGGRAVLATYGLHAAVISGPVTDSPMGEAYIRENLGIPAANARRNPEALFDLAFLRAQKRSLQLTTA